jgi:hypothetical protein
MFLDSSYRCFNNFAKIAKQETFAIGVFKETGRENERAFGKMFGRLFEIKF